MRAQLTRALVATATTVAATAAAVQPADAADPLRWVPYTLSSGWICEPALQPVSKVYVRTCVIRQDSVDVGAAVTVENRSPGAVSIAAPHLRLYRRTTSGAAFIYERNCRPATLLAGQARACVGPLTYRPCTEVRANSVVYVNWAEPAQTTRWVPTQCVSGS